MRPDVYFSVDVEADGPIPGDYSMLSLGAVVVGEPEHTFYVELRPVTERFDAKALRVAALDREALRARGADPAEAMRAFGDWVRLVAGKRRPVMIGFNASFDWSFVHWYFIHYVGEDPFGIAALDIKAYYMGALGKESWAQTTKGQLDDRFRSRLPHTHHALEDAREQAEIFVKVRDWARAREG